MKIWADNVKVGDEFWYERISGLPSSGFQYSTVVKKDTKNFRMPCLIMENGDRVFVNTWVYEHKSDIPAWVIEEAINYIESFILVHEDKIKVSQNIIDGLKNDIQELKKFIDNEKEE